MLKFEVASLGSQDGSIPSMGPVGLRSAIPGACVGSLPPRARWQRGCHGGVRIVGADCLPHSACRGSQFHTQSEYRPLIQPAPPLHLVHRWRLSDHAVYLP